MMMVAACDTRQVDTGVGLEFCVRPFFTVGAPDCKACGTRGEFIGWRLHMHELMARYQYVYGLKPVGPHQSTADAVLGDIRARCSRCAGEGILTVAVEPGWRICPQCEGTGGFWILPPAEVDHARATILKCYPDAAASSISGFLSVILLHDLAAGEMLAFPQAGGMALQSHSAKANDVQGSRRQPITARVATVPKAWVPPRQGAATRAIAAAFERAERKLGVKWKLKGKGHCPRVTVRSKYARAALSGKARSWEWGTPWNSSFKRRLWPRAVVEKAAAILGSRPRS